MDCCMQLHQWDQALQLAQRCNFTEAEDLLQQYAQHLLEKKKYLEAVELYRKVSVTHAMSHMPVWLGCHVDVKWGNHKLLQRFSVIQGVVSLEYFSKSMGLQVQLDNAVPTGVMNPTVRVCGVSTVQAMVLCVQVGLC